MTSSLWSRHFLQVTALLIAIGYLAWSLYPSLSVSAQQEGKKAIYVVDTDSSDPVKIVGVVVEKKQAKLNAGFLGGNDWLRDSQIIVKNISDKDIIYAELQIFMPETKSSGDEMMYQIKLGNKPGLPVFNDPFLLHANEEATFNLKDENYRSFLKFINSRHKIGDINRLNVRIGFVVFADSTGYSAGLRFKQDANNPRSWVPDNK
jgi:hypothetical protein